MSWFSFLEAPSSYAAGSRLKGFPRYRELLDRYFKPFWIANLLTVLGFLPLGLGFWILVSLQKPLAAVLICIPCGALAGPFLTALLDTIYRALRDAPGRWFENYQRGWRQNWRASIIPGVFLSLFLGLYGLTAVFLLFGRGGSWPLVLMVGFSLLIFTMFFTAFLPQVVLIDQPLGVMARNAILFMIQNFLPVFGVSLLQIVYWVLGLLFFPLTLFALPITGFWFILFLTNFLLYLRMDASFEIEAQIAERFPEQRAIYKEE